MEILTTKEVAELLKTSPRNVRAKVYRGQLPARKLGRRVVFIKKELEEYIESLPKAQADKR